MAKAFKRLVAAQFNRRIEELRNQAMENIRNRDPSDPLYEPNAYDPVEGKYFNDAVEREYERIMSFDHIKERKAKAKRELNKLRKRGSTLPDGQMVLPGFDPIPYEKNRTVVDNNGWMLTFGQANPRFLLEELERDNKHIQDVLKAYNEKKALVERFAEWDADHHEEPASERVLDQYVHLTGLLVEGDAPADEDAIDEDDE
jgi:hypothetical protein